jgi:hypothetical protein
MFLYCYNSCSNFIVGSSSTSQIVIILRDDPFEHLFIIPVVVACWLAAKLLEKLLVEPKTLGWEHSKKSFEKVFKNLGVVLTPLK